MGWDAPIKDRRLVAIIPDYVAEYFNNENIEGIGSFFSSIAKGAKSIGKDLYNLGYNMFKYSSNPQQIAFVGANDISQLTYSSPVTYSSPTVSVPSMTSIIPASENSEVYYSTPKVDKSKQSTKEAILKKAGGYLDDFMKVVAKVGGALAGRVLAEKIAKAAGVKNIPESEVYNRAIAWATANQQTLQKMGYPSPEAAAASALWAKNGLPPLPNENPKSVLRANVVYRKDVQKAIEETSREIEREAKQRGEYKMEHDIEFYAKKYWWAIAGFITLILLLRR